MKISGNLTDDAVLKEIGARITHQRLNSELKQADLAKQAGIGKRTLERIEAGEPSQTINMIRVLRVLGLLSSLEEALPDTRPSPMEMLKIQKTQKIRKRVVDRKKTTPDKGWFWSEDA